MKNLFSAPEFDHVTRRSLAAAYLDFVNNYISAKQFGEHRGLTVEQAHTLIVLGKACHIAELSDLRRAAA